MCLIKEKLKTKHYQYLYLQQKLDTRMEHENYHCEMYDCWHDTSKEHDRISFYYKWLIKINKKYNYA